MAVDTTEIRLQGLDAIERVLAGLPAKIERKMVIKALMAGAEVIRRDIAQRVPRDTGVLARNIIRRRSRLRRNEVYVGVRKLNKKQIAKLKARRKPGARGPDPSDPFYWVFQEFGFTTRDGRFIPGKRFMTQAFAAKGAAAVAAIEASLREQILLEGVR